MKSQVNIDAELAKLKKSGTSPEQYKDMFAEKKSKMLPDIILYTDGSYQDGVTSFAIVQQSTQTSYTILKQGLLPLHSGIFTAELSAIDYAVSFATQKKGKTLVCTDSLSVIYALSSNKKGIYNNVLIKPFNHCDITLLWIPSHIGIQGNERADMAAKQAPFIPLVYEIPCFPRLIINMYKRQNHQNTLHQWHNSNSFLRLHNPSIERRDYHPDFNREECISMARIRVGKALFNVKHYYEDTELARCSLCNIELDIPHIFTECPISKTDITIAEILDCSKHNHLKTKSPQTEY